MQCIEKIYKGESLTCQSHSLLLYGEPWTVFYFVVQKRESIPFIYIVRTNQNNNIGLIKIYRVR